ncbi:MAG: VTT domain-containing protein [Dehalococcoidia bacterium]
MALRPRRRWRDYILAGISLVVTVALCIFVAFYWEDVTSFAKYGYVGVLVISFLAGVTLFVPVPSVLVVFTLGAVLNPILIGLIAGFGEALGSMGIYLTGLTGARPMHALDSNVMKKFQIWMKTRGAISVFAMSAIFNPLFYPFTALAGMMHFGWWRFFILCLAGKTVKNTIVAGAGFFGVKALITLLGGHWPF